VELIRKVIDDMPCPVKYCQAKTGECCKTPIGNVCKKLHKKRIEKYVFKIYRETGKFLKDLNEEVIKYERP